MANESSGNTAYIDATGDSSFGTGKGDIFLVGVIFTPDAANDELELRDSSGGRIKFYARGATAKSTMFFDMADTPIRFTGAVHVQTITSGAKAILIRRVASA